jgi:hypothetical protein
MKYLACVPWPGLKVRTSNAEGFLTNVQVVLTFHSALGLDYEPIEAFVWEKLDDPDWEPPFDPHSLTIPMVAPPLARASSDPYPATWEHDDNGDLVVKLRSRS